MACKPVSATPAIIEDLKAGKDIAAIAEAYGKTHNAVYQIALANGLWKSERWTDEHKALVRREWRAGTPTATIAAMIGRTETAVSGMAARLGAKRPAGFTKPAPKTMAVLEDWKAGKEITAIARAHGKTRNAVYHIARAHGAWRGSEHVRA